MHVAPALSDNRRQLAEQALELRNTCPARAGGQLPDDAAAGHKPRRRFEACTAAFPAAMRSVHSRMLKDAMVASRQRTLRGRWSAFAAALSRLVPAPRWLPSSRCASAAALHHRVAQVYPLEIRHVLTASFNRLNAEYGFGLVLIRCPTSTASPTTSPPSSAITFTSG